MCNLSQGIREEATAKGLEKGRIEGNIEGLISSYLDFGATKEQILNAIMKKHCLTDKVAEYYYNKYQESLVF